MSKMCVLSNKIKARANFALRVHAGYRYERSVVDTPNADPTLTTADVEALSGMRLACGPEAKGTPYSYAGAGIGLFQYTDGKQPASTVTFDNLELWTYRVPTVCYVDPNSASPSSPYTNWATAAHVIQEAVDAASAGDEVLVTNGVYATGGRATGTNLLVNRVAVDKPMTLRSVNGPEFTIIQGYQVPGSTNGDGAVRCVYLADGATLSGFTLIHGATRTVDDYPGYRECSGGGVWCESKRALIANCVLATNSADFLGGGAFGGTLSNCALRGNQAHYGGGAYAPTGGSSCTLNNCSLIGHSAEYGGGARDAALNNCSLTCNTARYGGGAEECMLNNCILYFNTASVGGDNYDGSWGESVLNYCCTTPLPTNGTSNISLDPLLASATQLSEGSPCRGAGNPAYATGTDIDGEAWATPPSIGCDEIHLGTATGTLRVGLLANYTNVAVGYPVELTALIKGRTTASLWTFGDGAIASNRPYATHTWTAPGDYELILRAFNESLPVSAITTARIHVVAQPVHYVSIESTNPVLPYTSWATAATTVQGAVNAASTPGALVLASDGVYATGGRAVPGGMTNRVAVDKPLVLRSVNGPEFTVIRRYQVPGATNADGAIRCAYLADGASLLGFTLTNGATLSAEHGGGVWCESTHAVISNCVITGNSASSDGGGAYGGSLKNCTIADNVANGSGGGAYQATLNDCVLTGNSSSDWGGAIIFGTLNRCALLRNSAGNGGAAAWSTLKNCTVADNTATLFSGGTLNSAADDCLFIENSAGGGGGGAAGGALNNCTVSGNAAGCSGGGVSDGFPPDFFGWPSTLNNCIVYFNTATNGANYLQEHGGVLNYSSVTPMPTNGIGNITNAPLFVDAGAGDYRLLADSPCINAGNNAFAPGDTDLDGNPRIVSGTVDIGAYEFQGTGSAISYAWLQHYGLPTDGSADALDLDQDGYSTWQECRCQTCPTNALSALRLLSVSADGTDVTVTWHSVAGVSYFLECSTDLGAGPGFAPIAASLVGQPGTTSFTDTNALGLAPVFYRVGVQQ